MAAHLLDHFVFSSRRLQQNTKAVIFGIIAFMIVANFWWFKGLAFGIDGPIADHWGLLWRDVSFLMLLNDKNTGVLKNNFFQSWNIYYP